jgi:hypothetical protein
MKTEQKWHAFARYYEQELIASWSILPLCTKTLTWGTDDVSLVDFKDIGSVVGTYSLLTPMSVVTYPTFVLWQLATPPEFLMQAAISTLLRPFFSFENCSEKPACDKHIV